MRRSGGRETEDGVHETGRWYRKVRGMRLSYNRPSVSLGASRGHREEIYDAHPSVDGRSDGEVIHIEGGCVTGQGGKHKRSKSNGSLVRAGTDTTREVRRRSPETYWEGNARARGKHSGRDLTRVGGNGVRTQVLTITVLSNFNPTINTIRFWGAVWRYISLYPRRNMR